MELSPRYVNTWGWGIKLYHMLLDVLVYHARTGTIVEWLLPLSAGGLGEGPINRVVQYHVKARNIFFLNSIQRNKNQREANTCKDGKSHTAGSPVAVTWKIYKKKDEGEQVTYLLRDKSNKKSRMYFFSDKFFLLSNIRYFRSISHKFYFLISSWASIMPLPNWYIF